VLAVVLLIVLVSRTLALSRNKKPVVVFDTEEVRVVVFLASVTSVRHSNEVINKERRSECEQLSGGDLSEQTHPGYDEAGRKFCMVFESNQNVVLLNLTVQSHSWSIPPPHRIPTHELHYDRRVPAGTQWASVTARLRNSPREIFRLAAQFRAFQE